MAATPDPAAWWSSFGDDYDAAKVHAASVTRAPRAEEVLADQMALNARSLAQIRAKSELLEVAETTVARLRMELAETRHASDARESALQASLNEARATVDTLQASMASSATGADSDRKAAAEARAALDSHLGLHEAQVAALTKSLREVSDARDRALADLHEARSAELEGDAQRRVLTSALEDERNGGALERLAAVLTRTGGGPEAAASAAGAASSVASRIEELSAWAEERVARAEATATAAQAEAAQLALQLAGAPTADSLRAQVQQTAEARGKSRDLALQLKAAQREAAATKVRLDAAVVRAAAAEVALASREKLAVSPHAAVGQPPPAEPEHRWSKPTASSGQRRALAPRKGPSATTAVAMVPAKAPARSPAPVAMAAPSTDAVAMAVVVGGVSTGDGGFRGADEMRATLLEFLRASAAIVEPPLPVGAQGLVGELPVDDAAMPAGVAPASGDADHPAIVAAHAAETLRRQRTYVELAHQLSPMLRCLERCTAALRTRRLLRSVREEASDGTLDGLAAEVEGLVEAEAARQADLVGTPHGVAHHVLHKLQAQLEVHSVGEIAPRIDELTRAARLSLHLLNQLRTALNLDSNTTTSTCIATAARMAETHASLSATCTRA